MKRSKRVAENVCLSLLTSDAVQTKEIYLIDTYPALSILGTFTPGTNAVYYIICIFKECYRHNITITICNIIKIEGEKALCFN